jgi:beta-glucanase (GH16 family)
MRIARVVWSSFVSAAFLVAVLPQQAQAQWSDEFNGANGSALDSGTWGYDVGGGGWGNAELEVYNSGTANAWQENGYLRIQAKCCYTSARVKTQGKKTFSQGSTVEFRLRGPMGQGLWPAGWALGANITSVPWPGCGEIDIMEHINSIGNNVGTIHWLDNNGVNASYTASQPGVNYAAWNNYGIQWTSSYIRWTLNGAAVGDANILNSINGTDEFAAGKPFFLIFNVAVGGSWPGNPDGSTVFPANMDIDWLHVTGTSSGGGGTTPTPTPVPSGGGISGAHTISLFNNTSKRVDVNGASTADGTKIQIWDANSSAAQSWTFSTTGVTPAGFYNIAALGSHCMDVAGGNSAAGTKVQLWACNGTAAQSWNLVPVSGGYNLVSAVGSNMCLDSPGSSTTNGVQFQIYGCNGTGAQKFVIN